jgi:hypothetical protein
MVVRGGDIPRCAAAGRPMPHSFHSGHGQNHSGATAHDTMNTLHMGDCVAPLAMLCHHEVKHACKSCMMMMRVLEEHDGEVPRCDGYWCHL